jgi:hypothetical protein
VNWGDVLDAAASFALVLVALGVGYVCIRLAAVLEQSTKTLDTVDTQLGPLLEKANGTLDLVNVQLGKVDIVTDSAVDAVTAADRSTRAVVHAVGGPLSKLSAAAAGAQTALGSFRARRRARREGAA